MCQKFAEKEKGCRFWSKFGFLFVLLCVLFSNSNGPERSPLQTKKGLWKGKGPGTHNSETLVRHS